MHHSVYCVFTDMPLLGLISRLTHQKKNVRGACAKCGYGKLCSVLWLWQCFVTLCVSVCVYVHVSACTPLWVWGKRSSEMCFCGNEME